MKKKIVSALLTATMVCGMSVVPAVGVAAADDTITVGFSQVGAESDWRTANTESMKSTFSEENGYELIFDDAQQKQENQLTAIRNFIQQEVDYILLSSCNRDRLGYSSPGSKRCRYPCNHRRPYG